MITSKRTITWIGNDDWWWRPDLYILLVDTCPLFCPIFTLKTKNFVCLPSLIFTYIHNFMDFLVGKSNCFDNKIVPLIHADILTFYRWKNFLNRCQIFILKYHSLFTIQIKECHINFQLQLDLLKEWIFIKIVK